MLQLEELIKSEGYTVPVLCKIASEQPFTQWPPEILKSVLGQPISIFGYKHVAMDRKNTITLTEALTFTQLCNSKSEAYKAIKNNGIRLNGIKINNPHTELSAKNAISNLDAIVLEFGKCNYGIIELCD